MSLLLQLGCLERGQPMSLAALDPTDRAICLDLAYLGLLLPFWSASALPLGHARGAPPGLPVEHFVCPSALNPGLNLRQGSPHANCEG